MAVPLIAAEAWSVIHRLFVFFGVHDCYRNFVLAKVTKTVSAEMLLCRTSLRTQIRKNRRLQSFCRANQSLYYHARKKLLCLLPPRGPAIFQDFFRSCSADKG